MRDNGKRGVLTEEMMRDTSLKSISHSLSCLLTEYYLRDNESMRDKNVFSVLVREINYCLLLRMVWGATPKNALNDLLK